MEAEHCCQCDGCDCDEHFAFLRVDVPTLLPGQQSRCVKMHTLQKPTFKLPEYNHGRMAEMWVFRLGISGVSGQLATMYAL